MSETTFRELADSLADSERLRAENRKLTKEVARLIAERDAAQRILTPEQIAAFFDRNSVVCDNCGSQIVARGGSRGEHRCVSQVEGENEALCGFCAGEELAASEDSEKKLREALEESAEPFHQFMGHQADFKICWAPVCVKNRAALEPPKDVTEAGKP